MYLCLWGRQVCGWYNFDYIFTLKVHINKYFQAQADLPRTLANRLLEDLSFISSSRIWSRILALAAIAFRVILSPGRFILRNHGSHCKNTIRTCKYNSSWDLVQFLGLSVLWKQSFWIVSTLMPWCNGYDAKVRGLFMRWICNGNGFHVKFKATSSLSTWAR